VCGSQTGVEFRAADRFVAAKCARSWLPSQKGFVFELPQRQSAIGSLAS
jgi:hypothetical protein